MGSLFYKLFTRLRERGPKYVFVKSVEQIFRSYLPSRGHVTYNGISVAEKRLGDDIMESLCSEYRYRDRPTYEGPYVDAIREYFNGGDAVMIGGGMGVSLVTAAESTDRGEITVYEGSVEQVRNVEQTVALNNIGDHVTVVHGVVGDECSLRGEIGNATVIAPDELPDADALFIDCDGCEFSVLSSLSNFPELLIVEHHAVEEEGERVVEYHPEAIEKLLKSNSYEIADRTTIDHYIDKLDIFVAIR